MPMDLGMKGISNLGSTHCTTAVSLEMSDEPENTQTHTKLALSQIVHTTCL